MGSAPCPAWEPSVAPRMESALGGRGKDPVLQLSWGGSSPSGGTGRQKSQGPRGMDVGSSTGAAAWGTWCQQVPRWNPAPRGLQFLACKSTVEKMRNYGQHLGGWHCGTDLISIVTAASRRSLNLAGGLLWCIVVTGEPTSLRPSLRPWTLSKSIRTGKSVDVGSRPVGS